MTRNMKGEKKEKNERVTSLPFWIVCLQKIKVMIPFVSNHLKKN